MFGATGMTNTFVTTAGATFHLSGVQVEKGPISTPFEYRPYAIELPLCQRYYELNATPSNVIGSATTTIIAQSGNTFDAIFPFMVPKRVAPTVAPSVIDSSGFTVSPITSSSTTMARIGLTMTTTTQVGSTGWYYGWWSLKNSSNLVANAEYP